MHGHAEPGGTASRGLAAVRACALVAVAFSSAAAVEYYGTSHTFCAHGGGCDAVRESGVGQSLGRALPAIGVLGHGVVVAGTLARSPGVQLVALAGAVTGAIAGVVLLLLQATLGAFCSICVAVDGAALLAGGFALPLLRTRGALAVPDVRARSLWIAAAVTALGAAPAFALSRPSVKPAYVSALGREGKINVVEFSDFECPFCRALHPVLARALAPYGERLHFVRKVYPLPSHAHGQAAARAYLCAADQGQGEAMADLLFTVSDVSATAGVRHAASLGLDVTRFEQCVRAPATQRRLQEQIAGVRSSGMRGLPTVWIGDQVIEGFDRNAGTAPYSAALERAAHGRGTRSAAVPWLVLAALVAAALLPAARRAR
jgi:protein-disulfide isomerase